MSRKGDHITDTTGRPAPGDVEHRVLMLDPQRKDAETCAIILTEVGIGTTSCTTWSSIHEELTAGAAALLLAEEALAPGQIENLTAVLGQQPPWSDLPVLLLVGGGVESPLGTWVIENLGAARVLERPVKRLTLLNAVRLALRHRQRQYQLREFLAEQSKRQEELEASEKRMRAIFENAASGIEEVNVHDVVIAANDRLCQMLGYNREELLGKNLTELTWPEDLAHTRELVDQLHEGRVSMFEYEKRYVRKDGSPIWVHVGGSGVFDEHGKYLYSIGTVVDISARKQVEETLRRTEAEFRDLADAMPQIVFITNPEGRAEYINRQWFLYTGTTLEQTWNEGWTKELHPNDRERTAERWKHCLRTGEPFEIEYRFKRASDGSYRWHLGRVVPVHDERGKILRWFGTNTDIDEQKRAEERLEQRVRERTVDLAKALTQAEEGKATLDAVLESVPEGMTIGDVNGYRLRRVSRYMAESLGVDVKELEGMSVDEFVKRWEIFKVDGVTPVRAEDIPLMRAMRDGTIVRDYEMIARRETDGAKIQILSGAAPIRDGNGRIIGGVGAWRDITERKTVEKALRESEQRLRMAQQAARIGSFEWDIQADVNVWSPELESMYGLKPGEFGGREAHWEQLVHPEDRASALDVANRALQADHPVEGEWRVRWPDGSVHWVLGRCQVVKDASGKPLRLNGVNIDITERKLSEEALKELNARLAQRTEALAAAQQIAEQAKAAAEHANAAKDQFLAVLSHELRTPLSAVLPALEELAEEAPPASREDIEIALRNVELEARLIDDLLDVTRISRGKIELQRKNVDLCTILQCAAEVCAADIDARDQHFTIKIENGPHWVYADSVRLQQVFWNLIKNAIKFTPHGGNIGIHCFPGSEGCVQAEVSDNGRGIEPTALSRLFNAFEQADRAVTRQFGGLGLGLAISKALVELHGGTIEAHSDGKDQGATFTVKLPLHKTAAVEMATPRIEMPVGHAIPPARPLHILLVEDHGDSARIMRRLLIRQGHAVETAGDLATALNLVAQKSFDLLISDVGLPDGSGLDLMRQLAGQGRKIPAIALSGYGHEEDINQSHKAGFAIHLTKPVNIEQLLSAITTATGQSVTGARDNR